MNEDQLKGKWLEIKGEIAKKWGELTDDDLEKTKGNLKSLVGLLEQKLGLKKEDATNHLNEIAGRYTQDAKEVGKNIADKANQKIDESKDKLKH